MREYRVIVTDDAVADMSRFIDYLIYVKKNGQAAANILDDFDDTVKQLARVAGILAVCENPGLRTRRYRRINFLRHGYFMLYRLDGDTATVDAVGHELQDIDGILL